MARIRSIHPGLFTDEAFMLLTAECPLAIPLLIGLWTEADDAGAFEWKPLTIKARILPVAQCDITELLTTLAESGFIRCFEIDGRKIGVIRNFVRFQRPKSPVEVHPYTEESRNYAGFAPEGKRPNAGTGRPQSVTSSEQLPKPFGTPTESLPQMEDVGCRRKEEEETFCPKPATPHRTRLAYPEDFEAFWSGYPTDPIMSKKKAFEQWGRLSPDDRKAASGSVPGFRDYCQSHPDYRPVHAERFLSQRRFEQINARRKEIETASASNSVRVEVGSPEWNAWDAHYRDTHNKAPPSSNGRWFFPTAWPPGHEGNKAH